MGKKKYPWFSPEKRKLRLMFGITVDLETILDGDLNIQELYDVIAMYGGEITARSAEGNNVYICVQCIIDNIEILDVSRILDGFRGYGTAIVTSIDTVDLQEGVEVVQ